MNANSFPNAAREQSRRQRHGWLAPNGIVRNWYCGRRLSVDADYQRGLKAAGARCSSSMTFGRAGSYCATWSRQNPHVPASTYTERIPVPPRLGQIHMLRRNLRVGDGNGRFGQRAPNLIPCGSDPDNFDRMRCERLESSGIQSRDHRLSEEAIRMNAIATGSRRE